MFFFYQRRKKTSVPAIKKAEPLHKPDGLWLLSDFINGDEEAALISVIEEYMPSRSKILFALCRIFVCCIQAPFMDAMNKIILVTGKL